MKRSLIRRGIAVFLSLALIVCCFGVACMDAYKAYAQPSEEQYLLIDGYANQWARSDLRAWLNGLTKVDNNLPLDGSHGTKGGADAPNFLDCFTTAELALFQPQEVVTTMFNDGKFWGTTSEVVTKDLFWLPSGCYKVSDDEESVFLDYFDQLISADPGYDLSYYYSYIQKVENGQVAQWRDIIPIPYWACSANYPWLRSPAYNDKGNVVSSDYGWDVSSNEIIDTGNTNKIRTYAVCACGNIVLPSDLFTAVAAAPTVTNTSLLKIEISEYSKLDVKDDSFVPSWGMYLKEISAEIKLDGEVTYNTSNNELTFTSSNPLPKDKYLMVQVYKSWDKNTPTENAAAGDTVCIGSIEVLGEDTTSVTFTNTLDLKGYTVKVWAETPATNDSLASASEPLTFIISESGVAEVANETQSTNPRVFAYKSDLSCSWGVYGSEEECTFLEGREFDEDQSYVGVNATYQKLYIGTGTDKKPIEWWIAGRNGNTLTLYQNSANTGDEYTNLVGLPSPQYAHEFNSTVSEYTGDSFAKNPSLHLADGFTADDIADFVPKVTLKAKEEDSESLEASADTFSLQFCKTTGYEWTDAPDTSGEYYVRAAFSGETIDGTEYAPCFSNVQIIDVTAPVCVIDVAIKNGEKEAEEEQITIGGVLALTAEVSPDNADNTKVTWSVTAGDALIMLYKDEDCSEELSSSEEVESGAAVYIKASDICGEAAVMVTTVGVDSEGDQISKTCLITVVDANQLVIESSTQDWEYDGKVHSGTYKVTYGGTEVPADANSGGKVFTLPTGDTVTITTTDTGLKGVKDCADSSEGNNTFSYELTNEDCYLDVKSTVGTLSISQREVTLSWSDLKFPYDGKEHQPVVTITNLVEGDSCEVTVEGTAKEIGKDHTATATVLSNDNYKLPKDCGITFEIYGCTITFVDGDGNVLQSGVVAYGTKPVYTGNVPTKKATQQYTYTFNDTWEPEITEVTGDATYTAQFTATEITAETKKEYYLSSVKYGDGSAALDPKKDVPIHTKSDGISLIFEYKSNVEDSSTFDHSKSILVDGKAIPTGGSKTSRGSLIVELLPEFLDGLEVGEHSLTATFDDVDGDVVAKFRVEEKAAEPEEPETKPAEPEEPETKPAEPEEPETKPAEPETKPEEPVPTPTTGDVINLGLLVHAMLGAVVMIIAVNRRRRRA